MEGRRGVKRRVVLLSDRLPQAPMLWRGVPLHMSGMYPEYLNPGVFHRSVSADVLLREESDEEEKENDGGEEDDDDDEGCPE